MKKVNEYAKAGKDPEFGRLPEHLATFNMEKGPYYALKGIRAFFLTLGGVTVNPKFQALNPQGDVINNLYVVGQEDVYKRQLLMSRYRQYHVLAGAFRGSCFCL